MERKMIDEQELDKVIGGSIVFNADHTTCGFNCNDQFKVENYTAVLSFIVQNRFEMTEKRMLKRMLEMGYLSRIGE